MEATSVKKATRLEFTPPKTKHLLALKNMTLDNPPSIDNILIQLEKRHNERSWIVTFKVLAVLHFIMREGNCVRAVDGIIKRQGVLDTSKIKNKNSSPANVKNIYLYRAYLDERVTAYRHLGKDHIHEIKNSKGGRLRFLSISDGLLREIAALQRQLDSALECKFFFQEKDPRITLFVYKLVLKDIIAVFHSINEGILNMLEQYFKLNKATIKQAIEVYDKFIQQTELTKEYLNVAKAMEKELEMEIPEVKHASLTQKHCLEECLRHGSVVSKEKISTPQPLPTEDYFSSVEQTTAPLDRQLSLVTDQSSIAPTTPGFSNSATPTNSFPESVTLSISTSPHTSNPFLNMIHSPGYQPPLQRCNTQPETSFPVSQGHYGFPSLYRYNTQPAAYDTNPFRAHTSIDSKTYTMPLSPPDTPNSTSSWNTIFHKRPDFGFSHNLFHTT